MPILLVCMCMCMLCMLCILYIPRILLGTQTEGLDSYDIDSLVFDKVEHNPEKKNRVLTTFKLPLPLSTFKGPAKNSSDSVKKELQYLEQLSNTTDHDRKNLAMQIETKGVLHYFLNFAGSNGLVYDTAHLKQVAKDTVTLAYLLKSYYNRPRPYQLGFVLGYNLVPVRVARTSSYPCERTLLAKILAYQLSYNNPKFKDLLHGAAKKIELSRYYGGLNFPSDTVAALRVADILRDKIKYLEA